jgi:WD40 repeat protein
VLAGGGRFQVWALEPRSDDGPIDARRLELSDSLPEEFTSLALRHDGTLLALGDRSGGVTLLDTTRLRVAGRITPTGEEAAGMWLAMAFSPSGRELAVGSAQGPIALWNLDKPRAPELEYRLPGQRGFVMSLVFDSSGQRLASSSAGTEPLVEIWNPGLIKRELERLGLAK